MTRPHTSAEPTDPATSGPAATPGSSRPTKRQRGSKLAQRLRGSALARWAIGGLGAFYVWLCFRTTRWEWVGREHLDPLLEGPAFIGAVWHARLALVAMLRPRGRRAIALISENNDGDLIARVIANLGAQAARGSSRDPNKPDKERGGGAAMRELVEALEAGAIAVMTPDGPRGPRMRVKPGVAVTATHASVPVLPVAYSTRRGKLLRSWDRMLLPRPFDRGVWVFGAPIAPAALDDRAAIEAKMEQIEQALMAVTLEADRRMGRETPDQGETLVLP
ncbi:MAG: lysophospholipid acyltransferase family protein [Neomegalonema sp.]|nr:lysophospholipid acyltransferase family protein [Neomegalonema sp.]